MFGPSHAEIWLQVARDIGGQFQEGGFFGRDRVSYRHGAWTITLDTYCFSRATYTRMRAPFINKDGLAFRIKREGPIGQFFDIGQTGLAVPLYNGNLIISGNNEAKIRLLLDDDRLRRLINSQHLSSFEILDNDPDDGWFSCDVPKGTNELHFECIGVLKDEALLRNLFDMFSITLERLVQIDSAYQNDPKVVL